jgi:Ca-activated chloride channel family protein
MSQERLTQAVYAVQQLLGELRPEDRVMLLAIGSEVEPLTPLSIDHRTAYDALRDLRPWGTTPLFDATVAAIDAIQEAAGRRALLLITDGDDRYSSASASQTVETARKHDVLVYPVALRRSAPPVLVETASVTGGRSVAVSDMRSLAPALSGIANELRRQYLLGYAPDHGNAARAGWHSISVRVTRPGLRVRARDGYYAVR